jgi:predicted P-loop ATPase
VHRDWRPCTMKKTDVDKVKAFISRKVDRFRPPYGKNVIEAPRSSILVATTNLDDWSRDETGGRRFWPIQCKNEIDLDRIVSLRDQIWAEAVAHYRAGEPWWLTEDLAELAREEVAAQWRPLGRPDPRSDQDPIRGYPREAPERHIR